MKSKVIYRNVITGEFTTKEFAKANPNITEREVRKLCKCK